MKIQLLLHPRLTTVAALALVFVFSGCATNEAPASREASSPRIVFPNATVNGQPVRLIMDTGSEVTWLSNPATERLGLKSTPIPQFVVNASGTFAMTEPVQMTVDAQTSTTPLAVFPLPQITHSVEGAIGWPELRDNILVFDPAQRTVSAIDKLPAETSGWLKLKVHPSNSLVLEIPLPNNKIGTILVDTGQPNEGVGLPPAQWKEWRATHASIPAKIEESMQPGSDWGHLEIVWADEIKLGPLTLTDVPVEQESDYEASKSDAGKIGLYALTRIDLIVDGKNGFAYLRPKPPPGPPYPGIERPGVAALSAHEPGWNMDWIVADNVRLNIDSVLGFSFNMDATTKVNKGDYGGAIADYNHYIELDPITADADDIYAYRANAKYSQGDSAGALADYDKSIELRPDDTPYPRLYRQLLQLRLGNAPPDFATTVAGWKDGWTKNIGQFLNGAVDEKTLLVEAAKPGDEPVIGQQCEAYYYIGMMRLLKGDQSGARDFFQKSLATGQNSYDEYQFSRAELAHMDTAEKK